MKEIQISIEGEVGREDAQKKAESIARQENPDTFVISRYNRHANACSPCCLKGKIGEKPGWEIYGENHGGRLKITINNGEYVFILS
ncbi:MAG: AF1514 family protein [Proteobacteria bacterium]|nr:AF1514 family protein [Pseudomonadota bacterium]MBU1738898.1 AF1514 family protein [Pseudomonadota bacterium]